MWRWNGGLYHSCPMQLLVSIVLRYHQTSKPGLKKSSGFVSVHAEYFCFFFGERWGDSQKTAAHFQRETKCISKNHIQGTQFLALIQRATSIYLKSVPIYFNRKDSGETDFPWLVCWSIHYRIHNTFLHYNSKRQHQMRLRLGISRRILGVLSLS